MEVNYYMDNPAMEADPEGSNYPYRYTKLALYIFIKYLL